MTPEREKDIKDWIAHEASENAVFSLSLVKELMAEIDRLKSELIVDSERQEK